MKKLELTFTTGKSTMTITLDNPKEDLTLATVKAEAAKMIPVLITRAGAEVTGLEKAEIVNTTREALS